MLHEIISVISDVIWTVAPPLGALGFALAVIYGWDAIKKHLRRIKTSREALAIEAECAAEKQAQQAAKDRLAAYQNRIEQNTKKWAKAHGNVR